MKIGFIGLGIMGKPMVRNLLKAGHEVWVNNRSKAPMEELAKDGAHAVSRQELAENAEIIITMLPNGPQVKEVMLGDVVNYMHAGQIFIDCSSIGPVVSKEIAAVLAEKGVEMLDAPVSGGEPKAIDGTLSFMVGGKQEVFDACKDILAAMGASVTLCGDVGAGNTTKLANQIIVNLNIAAVSEALVLATKAGVDPMKVYRAIRGGLAGSTVLDAKAPMMCARNFKPGGTIRVNHKDIKNVLATAHEIDVPLPLTAELFEIQQALKVSGHMDDDHAGYVQYFEQLAGVEVRGEAQ